MNFILYLFQIVWGFYIGCNYEYYPDIDVEQAIVYTEKAKSLGLAGVMIWSINRDTDHRQSYDAGVCNFAQTGLPDGTYHTAISHVIDTPKAIPDFWNKNIQLPTLLLRIINHYSILGNSYEKWRKNFKKCSI